MKTILTAVFLIFSVAIDASAAEPGVKEPSDSVKSHQGDSISDKSSLFTRIKRFITTEPTPRTDGKPDVCFLAGPHYSSDTGFGLATYMSMLYKTDSLARMSNFNVYADATTKAHFRGGVYGTQFHRADSGRFDYDISFNYIMTRFWGIGYDTERHDSNGCNYRSFFMDALLEHTWRIFPGFYAGTGLRVKYNMARDMDKPWLWEHQRRVNWTWGPGLTLNYDTRDNLTDPRKGVRAVLSQYFYPRGLGNRMPFSVTTVTASTYIPVWKGALLAPKFYTSLAYGDPNWDMMPMLGGSVMMRGYFLGRYRDKCAMEACLEIRQHIYGPHGMVVWGGVGEVFPKLSRLTASKVLPNFGLGYRLRIRPDMNVRVDFGIGRGETGFIFSIYEAF